MAITPEQARAAGGMTGRDEMYLDKIDNEAAQFLRGNVGRMDESGRRLLFRAVCGSDNPKAVAAALCERYAAKGWHVSVRLDEPVQGSAQNPTIELFFYPTAKAAENAAEFGEAVHA